MNLKSKHFENDMQYMFSLLLDHECSYKNIKLPCNTKTSKNITIVWKKWAGYTSYAFFANVKRIMETT